MDENTEELQRLRDHNKQLVSELKAERAALKEAQEALQVAQQKAQEWRSKWHQAAVIEPFDQTLNALSVGPAKYLRQELLERGILKMLPDADGVERPAWFDLNGEPLEPADPWRFLAEMNDASLNRMIRHSGASGMGMRASASAYSPPESKPEAPATSQPPAFGLR